MIRFFIGFLITFGAVGGLDNDGDLFQCGILAVIGLAIMAWGTYDKFIKK